MVNKKASKIAHHNEAKRADGSWDLDNIKKNAAKAFALFDSGEESVVGMITVDLGDGKFLRGLVTQTN